MNIKYKGFSMSELLNRVPEHIAIIMDGNGRYAKKNKKPRSYGHVEGAKRVEPICKYCDDIGVKYLTLYAFSTENNKRPKSEVDKIMQLLGVYMTTMLKPMLSNNMKFSVIGDRDKIRPDLIKKIENLENETKNNSGLNLILAVNYGGRDEIYRAVKKQIENNVEIKSEDDITSALDLQIPDPDLIIRTGNEMRLSNFLLWQCAYSELYFCDKFWPEFMEEDLQKAVDEYMRRKRRFGGI